MKKIVMLMLSLLLMFSFTACGGGGGDSESTKSEKSDPNVMQIGDYKAEFKGYEIVKDSNEDDAIVVTWEYTNNGEEAKSFTWAFDYALTQDGEKLENSTVFVKDTYDAVDDANRCGTGEILRGEDRRQTAQPQESGKSRIREPRRGRNRLHGNRHHQVSPQP